MPMTCHIPVSREPLLRLECRGHIIVPTEGQALHRASAREEVMRRGRESILCSGFLCSKLGWIITKGKLQMKKRMTPLALVVVLLLVAAAPALAYGPSHQNQDRNRTGGQPDMMPGRQLFSLTGTITGLAADSITVMVHNGNRFVKPYIGQELVVLVTENTRYWQRTPDGYVPIGFGDVQVGDATSIRGIVSDETFTALRVTVDVPCCMP
jgi:hypothetical protein